MKTKFLLLCLLLAGCFGENKKQALSKPIDTSTKAFPVIIVKSKVDSTLIVIDTDSHLCWMKKDFSSINHRFLSQWSEIFSWTKQIDSTNYAGYSDWRVPTIEEYRTIDKSSEDRKVYKLKFIQFDSTFVWGKGPYSFWSSTTPNKNTASYISFIDGFATSGDRGKQYSNPYSSWKGTEFKMSVRLVRTIR